MKATSTTIETTTYNLPLTQEEAQFIVDVMQFVGGNAANTRRKHANTIQRALGEVGITPPFPIKDIAGPLGGRGITFE